MTGKTSGCSFLSVSQDRRFPMAPSLDNKVVVISGASGGIGSAIVERLLDEQAQIAGLGLYTSRVDRLARPGQFRFYETDLTSHGSVQRTVSGIISDTGGPNVVINAAGLYRMDYFTRMGMEEYNRIIDVNLRGPVALYHALLTAYLTNAAYTRELDQAIDIVSLAMCSTYGGDSVAAATKAGATALSLGLAKESQRIRTSRDPRVRQGMGRLEHIRFSRVYPEAVDTGIYLPSEGNLVEPVDDFPKMPPAVVGRVVRNIIVDSDYRAADDFVIAIQGDRYIVRFHQLSGDGVPDYTRAVKEIMVK